MYSRATGEFEFRPGGIFANIVLGDEINRASPKTQSALLEAMEERQVTVDATTYRLDPPFMVIATQNPIEHEGTYPLPDSQLDRFLMRIPMGYPGPRRPRSRSSTPTARRPRWSTTSKPVATVADVETMIAMAQAVHVAPSLKGYIVDLAEATRRHPDLALGVSPRAALALQRAARAHAAASGRDYVVPDDLKALAAPVLEHRLALTPEAQIRGVQPQRAAGRGARPRAGAERPRQCAGLTDVLDPAGLARRLAGAVALIARGPAARHPRAVRAGRRAAALVDRRARAGARSTQVRLTPPGTSTRRASSPAPTAGSSCELANRAPAHAGAHRPRPVRPRPPPGPLPARPAAPRRRRHAPPTACPPNAGASSRSGRSRSPTRTRSGSRRPVRSWPRPPSSPCTPRSTRIVPLPQTHGHDPLAGADHPTALGVAGEDFYALRAYEMGDDLRRVHWPSTARVDELMIRQNEMPWQGRATVLLDARARAHDGESLELAVRGRGEHRERVLAQGSLVRLVTTDGADSGFAAGQAHVEAIMERLAIVRAARERPPRERARRPAARRQRRRAGRGGHRDRPERGARAAGPSPRPLRVAVARADRALRVGARCHVGPPHAAPSVATLVRVTGDVPFAAAWNRAFAGRSRAARRHCRGGAREHR